jgi:outer membrane receptor protein involved in Fe transport
MTRKASHTFVSALCAVLFVIAHPAAFAQTATTGDVAGVVKDATDAVIAGATVTLKSLDRGEARTATTNEVGAYRFTFLRPGHYTVAAESTGLKTSVVAINVQVGQVANIDLTAAIQATQQVVEVTSAASALETDNANLATTFSATQVQELPMPGGDLSTVAFTVPGIVVSTGAGYGNFTSHGLPGTSNLFIINGNDYNDAYLNLNNSGASNLLLGANEIQEASVIQNAYSVQYGRQAGAQVNYVTKAGTNSFHGNLLWNWNGDSLNANDFFNNASGVGRPRAVSNQYAASFGGHVIKNKLFFFADTEGIRYLLPSSGVVTVPSPQLQSYILGNLSSAQLPLYQSAFNYWNSAPGNAAKIPVTNGAGLLQDGTGNLGCGQLASSNIAAPGGGIFGQTVSCADAWGANGSNLNTEWLLTTRVDYNINDRQRLNFRFKTDHGKQPTETSLINPVFNVQSIQPQFEGQMNHNWVISPTIVNNFIGSALWYSANFSPANVASSLQAFPSNFFIVDGGSNGSAGFTQMGIGNQGLGYNLFPQGRNVGQLQLTDDLSVVKGSHTIKIGANFRRNRVTDSSLLQSFYGYYTFNSLADFANGVTNPNTLSSYSQSFPSIEAAHIRLYNLGVYAQDEWAVKPNLKVTFGLRLDRTGNPLCVDKCFARLNEPFSSDAFQKGADIPYNQSIDSGLANAYPSIESVVPQPRLGVVWSPRGANSTVIRGGVGLFSDLAPGGLVSNIFINSPNSYVANVFNGAQVAPASDPNSAAAVAAATASTFRTGFANGYTLAQFNNALQSVGGFAPPPYYSVAQNILTPKYLEWSFEIQQPIGSKNVLVATYTGNHGYDLLIQNGFVNGYVNTANFPNGFGNLPLSPPDPRFNNITELSNQGISNYDGLTVQYRRTFAAGFQGQLSYTWSHALDDISNGGNLEYYSVFNSMTILSSPSVRNNYGNSDYDVRNSLLADFVWEMPWRFSHRGVNTFLGGWTLSGKFFARTGMPFSVTDGELLGLLSPAIAANAQNGVGPLLAEVLDQGVSTHCGSGSVNTPCFTTSQFATPTSQTGFGNFARNAFFGPGYFDIDTSLYKKIAVTERVSFTIGASAYNILNHPNFGDPGANVSASGLGLIVRTATPPTSAYGSFQGSAVSGRVMVLTGRFNF